MKKHDTYSVSRSGTNGRFFSARPSVWLTICSIFWSGYLTLSDDLEKRRAFMMNSEGRANQYQNAHEAFPFRTVEAADKVWSLNREDNAEEFSVSYRFNNEDFGVTEFNRRTHSSALLILHGETIKLESYLAGSSAQTKFFSFSAGKSITSTMVGIAFDDGLIPTLDMPLKRYLPALTGTAYDMASIKDTLQMMTGVTFDTDHLDWRDESVPFVKIYKDSMIEQKYRFVEGANALRAESPVGSKFIYNTMNSALLGWLVENVTGKRLATYMEERLWKPAGMEFDSMWFLDGSPEIGREMAGGCFAATLRDYGRFGLLFANDGWANGTQVLSKEWIEAATIPNRPGLKYGMLFPGSRLGYGFQWWLHENGSYSAQGVYGQFIYVDPEADVVIVKLSHWPEIWSETWELECYAFFDAVVKRLAE